MLRFGGFYFCYLIDFVMRNSMLLYFLFVSFAVNGQLKTEDKLNAIIYLGMLAVQCIHFGIINNMYHYGNISLHHVEKIAMCQQMIHGVEMKSS